MKKYFDIKLCSLFFISYVSLLSPLHAQQATSELLISKISENLADDMFPTERINEVIDSSQCSLQQAATTAAVLISIKKPQFNKEVFSWVLDADDENECQRKVNMMELVWDYRRRKKISSLWINNNQLYWRDTRGIEGVPIVADDLAWNSALETVLNESKSIQKTAWVSGQVSDEAATEMRNRGITVSANRFSKIGDRQNIANRILGLSKSPEPTPIPAPVAIEEVAEHEIPASEPEPEPIEVPLGPSEAAAELPEKEIPVSEPIVLEETIITEEEHSPDSELDEEPVLSPSPLVEPEQTRQVIVKKSNCWKHAKLGRFIITEQNGLVELTHEIIANNESRNFKLSTIGKQYYWRVNNVVHVFTKYKQEMMLTTNFFKNKNEIPLIKCEK